MEGNPGAEGALPTTASGHQLQTWAFQLHLWAASRARGGKGGRLEVFRPHSSSVAFSMPSLNQDFFFPVASGKKLTSKRLKEKRKKRGNRVNGLM